MLTDFQQTKVNNKERKTKNIINFVGAESDYPLIKQLQEMISDKPKNAENYAIIIGRQFGSGGRRIGKKLASLLDISYYDSELLAEAAKKIGVSEEVFKEHDEKKPSLLRALLQGAYGIPDNFHSVGLTGEHIYQEQSRVIREICSKEPCVIVGRTADVILRDNFQTLSVFLHSPLRYRAGNIISRGEAANIEEAMEIAKSRDKKRESYYNYYAGEKIWGLASNYDISMDTSILSEDKIIRIIAEMAKNKFTQK